MQILRIYILEALSFASQQYCFNKTRYLAYNNKSNTAAPNKRNKIDTYRYEYSFTHSKGPNDPAFCCGLYQNSGRAF